MLSLYMFHRIIFFLLVVGSLSCNFNRRAVCFQSFSEHRLQEYSKYRAYQTGAFKDYTSINHLIKLNKHNNFFIMLQLNSSMFVQTLSTARTGVSIVLNSE